MNTELLLIISQAFLYLTLSIYVLVKHVVIPRRNHRRNENPGKDGNRINIDRFYQEFIDFKEAQCKWNDKIEHRLDDDDKRIDGLEKNAAKRNLS